MNISFEKEVRERWGQTQAYREYEEKHPSGQVQSLVKKLQGYITEHYYHCTNQILAGLGQMYVADERFKHNIDKHADGNASFICEAITAYCCK